MSQVAEYVKMALMNIRSNKGRSFLTMLGIIIGISSVILVISVGQGISGAVNNSLTALAGGQLYFYSGGMDVGAGLVMTGQEEEPIEFTFDDLEELREKIPHVKGASPVISGYGQADGPKESGLTAYFYGGTDALQYNYQEPIIKGRYFNRSDFDAVSKVCVIRESSAMCLYGSTDVIGNTFEADIYGKSMEFKVIGIRQDPESSKIMNLLMGLDQVEIETPATVLGEYFDIDVDNFEGFYVYTDGPEYSSEAAASILRFLRTKYHVADDSTAIQMQDFNDSMDQITKILDY
ncbi:MAG: ABC transporter permease, partial [Lachnospiraceae bacterium]|nr:ABC transporter permease [Lachnospiraceae bacterium]